MNNDDHFDLDEDHGPPEVPFELDGEDISVIAGIMKSTSKIPSKSSKSTSRNYHRSHDTKDSKLNFTKTQAHSKPYRFVEDELEPDREPSPLLTKSKSRALPDKRKRKANSDEESESDFAYARKVSRVLDDSVNLDVLINRRVTYLNIMIAGESKLCKEAFISHIFEQVYGSPMPAFNPEEKINEFTISRTVKKQTKVTTFAHVFGFSSRHSVKDWYKIMKRHLKEKMDVYKSLNKIYSDPGEKQLVDMRVHMVFFFVKSPKLRLNESLIMKKLQKYAVIVPIIIDKNPESFVNSEYVRAIKLNMLKEMATYQINHLMFEQDPTLSKIRENLIGGISPFFISAPNGIIEAGNAYSDLSQLVKLVTAPFVSSYYLQTEVLYNKFIEKSSAKVAEKKKQTAKDEDPESQKIGFGFGLALGIGVVGALVALKNKLT